MEFAFFLFDLNLRTLGHVIEHLPGYQRLQLLHSDVGAVI
jgi:hypothetical protein